MSDPAAAIRMLDMVEELLDGGKRWTRGRLVDQQGNHCLVGAIRHVRETYGLEKNDAERYLTDCIPQVWQRVSFPNTKIVCIEAFNDRAKSYAAIKKLIDRARQRAASELSQYQPPKPSRRAAPPIAPKIDRCVTETAQIIAQPQPVIPEPVPVPTPEPNWRPIADIGIPLAVLKYLSPARIAELRQSAPGACCSLDSIERERKRSATVESLKRSVSEAINARQLELTD
jgi:hypothetical protein